MVLGDLFLNSLVLLFLSFFHFHLLLFFLTPNFLYFLFPPKWGLYVVLTDFSAALCFLEFFFFFLGAYNTSETMIIRPYVLIVGYYKASDLILPQ